MMKMNHIQVTNNNHNVFINNKYDKLTFIIFIYFLKHLILFESVHLLLSFHLAEIFLLSIFLVDYIMLFPDKVMKILCQHWDFFHLHYLLILVLYQVYVYHFDPEEFGQELYQKEPDWKEPDWKEPD